MKLLTQAVSAALCTLGLLSTATAATYVVQANGNSFDSRLAQRIQASGGRISATLPQIGVAVVESDDARFAERAGRIAGIRSVAKDVQIQFEQPEMLEIGEEAFVNPPLATGMDQLFNLQWGHAAIDAAGAWNQGYFGAGATVAVLDSGVRCTHPDLASNILLGQAASFVPGESACNTSGSSHGTHVAGTIAARMTGAGPNSGVIGVAPQAKIIPVKVLSATTGSGSFSGIIQGIVYAADQGADVINMSLGVRGGLPIGGNDTAELVNATARAMRHARAAGSLVVVSAGNDGRDLDHDSATEICDTDGNCDTYNLKAFPAQLPGTVTVSATAPTGWALAPTSTDLDGVATYTNYGRSAIDIAAPGGDAAYPGNEFCTVVITNRCWVFDLVLSTTLGGWGWQAGTSMAAPHVSGVAALIIGKHGGTLGPAQVEAILAQSADQPAQGNGRSAYFGHGRVNAARAVAQ